MKYNQLLRRDNALIGYIREHKGKNNAVSNKQLAQYLSDQGYSTKSEAIHGLISKIINERGLPICSLNANGYFWASCQDDILAAVGHLQGRIDKLQERIDVLKSFIL